MLKPRASFSQLSFLYMCIIYCQDMNVNSICYSFEEILVGFGHAILRGVVGGLIKRQEMIIYYNSV